MWGKKRFNKKELCVSVEGQGTLLGVAEGRLGFALVTLEMHTHRPPAAPVKLNCTGSKFAGQMNEFVCCFQADGMVTVLVTDQQDNAAKAQAGDGFLAVTASVHPQTGVLLNATAAGCHA